MGIYSSKDADSYNKKYIKNHSNYELILEVYRDYYSRDKDSNSVIKSIINLMITECVKHFLLPLYEEEESRNEDNIEEIKNKFNIIKNNFESILSNERRNIIRSEMKNTKTKIIDSLPTVNTENLKKLNININTLMELLKSIQTEINDFGTMIKLEKDYLDNLNWFQRRFINVSWRKKNYDNFKTELDILNMDVKLRISEINGAQTQFNRIQTKLNSDDELSTKYSTLITRINLMFPEYRINGNAPQ